ncbi:hypothetical protein WJX77_012397 [Trebouxia sp. C0004]
MASNSIEDIPMLLVPTAVAELTEGYLTSLPNLGSSAQIWIELIATPQNWTMTGNQAATGLARQLMCSPCNQNIDAIGMQEPTVSQWQAQPSRLSLPFEGS